MITVLKNMTPFISILFRAIPLLMGGICLSLGILILCQDQSPVGIVSGLVLIALTSICIALFSTAAVIIRQLIHAFTRCDARFYPTLGYVLAACSIVAGGIIYGMYPHGPYYVAGHVMIGIGLVAACVSTVALSSIKFTMIPQNSALPSSHKPDNAFSSSMSYLLICLPIVFSGVGWIWGGCLLGQCTGVDAWVAGIVMCGLASICTCLIMLVSSIVLQINNQYQLWHRPLFIIPVLILGFLCVLAGIILACVSIPGLWACSFVLMGLGMICLSISSKIILLALVWKEPCSFASRIPIIPVVTALICTFLAAYLFVEENYIPELALSARVITGLGAVCFTLFSIVSILESGTSTKKQD